MPLYTFHVKGSSPKPYEVTITTDPLSATCTCPAAHTHTPCKHRIQILAGHDPGIVDGPVDQLPIISRSAHADGWHELIESWPKLREAAKMARKAADHAAWDYQHAEAMFRQGEYKTDRVVKKNKAKLQTAFEEAVQAEAIYQSTTASVLDVMA